MAALTAPFDVSLKDGNTILVPAAAVKSYRGGAASIILGTGLATPLVPATALSVFIGVYLATNDNTSGNTVPADQTYVPVQTKGLARFNQSTITAAAIGTRAYFSDDNTITTTAGKIFAGIIRTVDEANGYAWVDISDATYKLDQASPYVLSANGTIPTAPGTYVVTMGSAAALTLGAPTTGTQDGLKLTITSNTAYAHVVTATGLLQTGANTTNTATFAAYAGASVNLMAYGGKWNVISANQITFA